jgi:hypothetical protein
MPGVELATLPIGVLWYETAGGVLAPAAGASVYIYQHVVPPATPSVQIQIYSDEGLTIPISQPLTADSQGALPGYIDAPASGDVGKIFDVVPTFNSVTLSPQMGNAVRGDTAMSGGGGGGPTSSALGVNTITGPTGAIAASATTNFTVTIPSWVEQNFSRIVVGLIITHPDISQLKAVLSNGTQYSILFQAGVFISEANLGDPTRPTDPDAFVYFSDLANPANAGSLGLSEHGQDWTVFAAAAPLNAAGSPSSFTFDAIMAPDTTDLVQGEAPLASVSTHSTGNLTLSITESGGSTGTLTASVVFLISGQFDAIRGFIPPIPAPPGVSSTNDGEPLPGPVVLTYAHGNINTHPTPHDTRWPSGPSQYHMRWSKPSAYNSADLGVVADGQIFTNGHMTSGSAVLTSASNPFLPSDVGKIIAVSQALSTNPFDHNTLTGMISSYQSASQVTLDTAADQTITTAHFAFGTDNGTALFNIQTSGILSGPKTPGIFHLPSGIIMYAGFGGWGNGVYEGCGDQTLLLCTIGNIVSGAGSPGDILAVYRGFANPNLPETCVLRNFSVATALNYSNWITSQPSPSSTVNDVFISGPAHVRVVLEDVNIVADTTYNCVNPPFNGLQISTTGGGVVEIKGGKIIGQGGQALTVVANSGIITVRTARIGTKDVFSLGNVYDIVSTGTNGLLLDNIDTQTESAGIGMHLGNVGAPSLRVRNCNTSKIQIVANSTSFQITDNDCTAGIVVESGTSDHYSIIGNDTHGVGVTDGGSGTHKAVANNY